MIRPVWRRLDCCPTMSCEAFNLRSSPGPRHGAAALVVALHVLAIYGFAQWTVVRDAPLERAPLQVAIVTEEKIPTRQIPPPPPAFAHPGVSIEMPVLAIPQQ